ncbi:hypothetical protein [Nocardioides albus]|uniref:Uncharacterized protein n=1 Tax=Nocardioides albus TaxID=1841 RepID=A0A7W5A603_9ACTN|nr:hypothetical protein [Nocardioides albus]MBB3090277.1 hypothetical protein [Nocardioides albus]GGU28995.1 hypothetical protein GCM10007979_29870 [Nocardioides albus]
MKFGEGVSTRLGVLLAASFAVLAAGCADLPELPEGARPSAAPSHPPYAATPADYKAVQDLLTRRAGAALKGDEAGFLATVDRRDQKLVDQQQTIFTNLQQLPMKSLAYEVEETEHTPDEVRNDGVLFAPKVVEVARLEEAHRAPVASSTDMTFVRHDGGWVIGRDRAAPTERYSRPWFGGPVTAATGRSVVVVTEREGPTEAAELLDRVTTARAEIKEDLRSVWRGEAGETPLIVDATFNGQPPGGTFEGDDGAAAVTYWVDAVGPPRSDMSSLAGAVIKDNPTATNRLATDDRTLRHELSHVYGPALVPTWVNEGLAEYLSGCASNICGEDEQRDKLLAHERAIPGDDEWGEDGSIDYAISHAAVSWLIEENGGLKKFLEFCNDFFLHKPGGREDFHDGTGKALRASYGLTERDLIEGTWGWFEDLPTG